VTTTELLAHLRARGITLSAEGGALKVSAPAGALTPELRSDLAARKAELIELLEQARRQRPASQPSRPRSSGVQRAPLALPQQRMWFFERAQPGTSVMNISLAVRLRGPVDDARLEEALQRLAARHETLRLRIEDGAQGPQQVAEPDVPVPLTRVDLRGSGASSVDDEIQRLKKEDASKPFDLGRAPLWRVLEVRAADDDRILLFTFHHVIADAWSLAVVVQELAAHYNALTAAPGAELPELARTYFDYAIEQSSADGDAAMAAQLAYWRTKLDGDLPVLDLPTDAPRPPFQTYSGGAVEARLSGAAYDGLTAIGRQQRASLFMVLVAAFQVLMSRLSGQTDVIVGTPIAGREDRQMEPLIGLFINMLALRTTVDAGSTFLSLLGQVRETALEAFANQLPPFERVVQQSRVRRDPSRTPIFQVLFNMVDGRLPLPETLGEATLTLDGIEQPPSRFDLTLYAVSEADGVTLKLVYNTDLFSHARAEEMLSQYVSLLEQIAAAPDAPVGSYSLLSGRARGVLPDPAAPLPASTQPPVHQLVLARMQQAPDRAAIADNMEQWSYGQLHERSGRIAGALRRLGVGRGKLVAIVAYRSAELVAAMLGVWRAGASLMVLDVAYPASRLLARLDVATPDAVIRLEGAGDLADELESRISGFSAALTLPQGGSAIDWALAEYEDPGVIEVSGDDQAYVAFTSGSTGAPRGIVGPHAPVSHFLSWHIEQFAIGSEDRVAMLSGLSHDPLLRDILTPLACGGTLCIPDPDELLTPGWLADWMRREQITVAHLTPAMAAVLTANVETDDPIPSLRRVFFGGEVLRSAMVARLARLAPEAMCVNFYGATETPQAMGFHVVAQDDGDVVPLGKGIDAVQLLVMTDSGQLAGIGELGEICVRTPYLSRGYLNADEEGNARFATNPFTNSDGDRIYRTGDRGRFLPDGSVSYAGRRDGQVKVRGYRVELAEIEAALARHAAVKSAAVSLHSDAGGERLVAYMVLNDGAEPMASELRRFLRRDLPEYMIPALFVPVPAIPVTPNGKVDRRALVPPDTLSRRDQPRVLPRTPVEKTVAEIWREVLGDVEVSVHDNFFDLGGHSLNSIEVVARLQARLGVEIHPGHLILESLEQISADCERQLLQKGVNPQTAARGAGAES